MKKLYKDVLGGIALIVIFIGGLWEVYSQTQLIEYARADEIVIQEEPKPQEVKIEVTFSKERVEEIYKEAAKKHGVSEHKMLVTMRCESFGGVYNIQSQHRYSFSDPARGIFIGEQEMSFGPSQIHLPDHPHVTREQAEDPYFAAEFMAKAFASGKASWWTCYRMNFN